jgi:hypothetical protein
MTSAGSSFTLDRSMIGTSSTPSVHRVTTEQLKFFAKATDQRDPVYFNEQAAYAAGHRAIPAPLTFAYSLMLASFEKAGGVYGFRATNADIRYLLHGEQGFRYHQLLYAEDEVTMTTQLVDLYVKKGGLLCFIEQLTILVNQLDEPCVELDTKFIVQQPEARS